MFPAIKIWIFAGCFCASFVFILFKLISGPKTKLTAIPNTNISCFVIKKAGSDQQILFAPTLLESLNELDPYLKNLKRSSISFRAPKKIQDSLERVTKQLSFELSTCMENSLFLQAAQSSASRTIIFDLRDDAKDNLNSLQPPNAETQFSKMIYQCDFSQTSIFDPVNHHDCSDKIVLNNKQCYKLCNHQYTSILHFPIITDPTCLSVPILLGNQSIPNNFDLKRVLLDYNHYWLLFIMNHADASIDFNKKTSWSAYAKILLNTAGVGMRFYGQHSTEVEAEMESDQFDFFGHDWMLRPNSLAEEFMELECTSTFGDCMISLGYMFYENSLFDLSEYESVEIWVQQLNSIGYQFPSIKTSANYESCRRAYFDTKNMVSIDDSVIGLSSLCGAALNKDERCLWAEEGNKTKSVIKDDFSLNATSKFTPKKFGQWKTTGLVIAFNFPIHVALQTLQDLYEPHFAAVVFCSQFGYGSHVYPYDISFVSFERPENSNGFQYYACYNWALELGISVTGWLQIGDDVLMHFWKPLDLNQFQYANAGTHNGWWIKMGIGKGAIINILNDRQIDPASTMGKIWAEYRKRTLTLSRIPGRSFGEQFMYPLAMTADFFYIPKRLSTKAYWLFSLFYRHMLFAELAVPKVAMDMDGWVERWANNTLNNTRGLYLWKERAEWAKYYDPDDDSRYFLHPVKFSMLKGTFRKCYCVIYVKRLLKNIYQL